MPCTRPLRRQGDPAQAASLPTQEATRSRLCGGRAIRPPATERRMGNGGGGGVIDTATGAGHGVDHGASHGVDHGAGHGVGHGAGHGVDHGAGHGVDHGAGHGVGHGVGTTRSRRAGLDCAHFSHVGCVREGGGGGAGRGRGAGERGIEREGDLGPAMEEKGAEGT